ncbi:uncharacterized protein LOC108152511 [Drosophila miranda]|uniref:uncharacterized protein LOC108152511 n=1 Tax=Drosophila miranda TaxID=7229 RepID=UPI0007E73471|nr:uncharacterized protein LOC108152511 [Drosophila miranda]
MVFDFNMLRAKKCCFCVSLQTGCILFALFQLFCSGMNIDYIFNLLNNTVAYESTYVFPAQVTQTVLQLVPDLLTVVASFVLLAAIISQYLPLFWVPMLMHLVQVTYLLVFSIISAAMGKNLIVNQSFGHNITYWIYVVAWLGMTLYFFYITYSYYRELKAESAPSGRVVQRSEI